MYTVIGVITVSEKTIDQFKVKEITFDFKDNDVSIAGEYVFEGRTFGHSLWCRKIDMTKPVNEVIAELESKLKTEINTFVQEELLDILKEEKGEL